MSTNDPFSSAMDAEYKPQTGAYRVFGEVDTDAWFCKLVTGQGKVVWDEQADSVEDRRTAIKISVIPLRAGRRDDVREMIAESKEWAEIVKPSLAEVGESLSSIKGKFAQAELVPTGRKLPAKNGYAERDATTFKFVAVYASKEACQAAADEFFGSRNSAADATASSTAPVEAPANDAERATAAQFLPALWRMANGNEEEFAKQLAATPLVSKYFNADSPEVKALISQQPVTA